MIARFPFSFHPLFLSFIINRIRCQSGIDTDVGRTMSFKTGRNRRRRVHGLQLLTLILRFVLRSILRSIFRLESRLHCCRSVINGGFISENLKNWFIRFLSHSRWSIEVQLISHKLSKSRFLYFQVIHLTFNPLVISLRSPRWIDLPMCILMTNWTE